MGFFLLALALLVAPTSALRLHSVCEHSQKQSSKPIMITGTDFLHAIASVCLIICASLRSGKSVSCSYSLALEAVGPQYYHAFSHIIMSPHSPELLINPLRQTTPVPIAFSSSFKHYGALLGTISDQMRTSYDLAQLSGARIIPSLESSHERILEQFTLHLVSQSHKAGLSITAPLVLCFLPAFLLLGIIPTVISLSATIFGT